MRIQSYANVLFTAIFCGFLLAAPLSADAADKVIGSGTFVGSSGHTTKGRVVVMKTAKETVVILESDFNFDGAPDPKVGFGKNGAYDDRGELAALQSNNGRQVYSVPASVNTADYNEVYIWCEQFSVPLGVAKLQ